MKPTTLTAAAKSDVDLDKLTLAQVGTRYFGSLQWRHAATSDFTPDEDGVSSAPSSNGPFCPLSSSGHAPDDFVVDQFIPSSS
jgi:hypothetical protein